MSLAAGGNAGERFSVGRRNRRRVVGCLAVALTVGPGLQAQPGKARVETYEVTDSGALTLIVPAGWTSEVGRENELAPTIELRPGGGRDALLLLTALPPRPGAVLSPEQVLAQVTALGQVMLATAVQTEVQVVELEGAEATGYFFHLTDREAEAEPGDYREARQGALLVGPLLLSVTVLSHSGDQSSVEEALGVLASARHLVQTE